MIPGGGPWSLRFHGNDRLCDILIFVAIKDYDRLDSKTVFFIQLVRLLTKSRKICSSSLACINNLPSG